MAFKFVNSNLTSLLPHTVAQATKWLKFLGKNLHLVGRATVCAKSEVMLEYIQSWVYVNGVLRSRIKSFYDIAAVVSLLAQKKNFPPFSGRPAQIPVAKLCKYIN